MVKHPRWVKVCSKDLRCRELQLTLGENVDVHPYDPALCKRGGLHFCDKKDAPEWAHKLEYDWVCDVSIPPDAEVTRGPDKSKASKLILSNHRPLRECPDIYLAAVNYDERMLMYCPHEVTTLEVCLAAVRRTGHMLKWVPDDLRTLEVCLAAVQHDGLALRHVALKTTEMCLTAVQQDGLSLEYVPDDLKTYDMCLAAVQRVWSALEYVPGHFKTVEMCLAAVQHYDYTFEHLTDNLDTLKMCLAHVQQRKASTYVLDTLKERIQRLESNV